MIDEKMELDLGFQEVTIELRDPTTGNTMAYMLRELNGTQRDQYLTELARRVRTEDGKVVGVKNFNGIQSSLLAKCLYKKDDETGEWKLVAEADIQKMPARVQKALFDKAKELSALDEDAEEEAGND